MSDSVRLSVITIQSGADLRAPRRVRSALPLIQRHPSHRHAAPSGPWPWMDLDSEDISEDSSEARKVYPQALFGNWTPAQVRRSGIKEAIDNKGQCEVYPVDIFEDGVFKKYERHVITDHVDSEAKFRDYLNAPREEGIRVRALCVENLSGPVLQMLGTSNSSFAWNSFNIEPFFFSSSLNWIPSRYQEDRRPGQGDHVTITLTFLRKVDLPGLSPSPAENQGIDTDEPLYLASGRGNKKLLRDLLAVHMIRSIEGSTIISYHPSPGAGTTSAMKLHSRVHLAGNSVYWSKIFDQSTDPTFVLLTMLWHACYSWDEALSSLYEHITDQESTVINTKDKELTKRTRDLHRIRAHLLHYASLLNDFRKSVEFVKRTPNPAMEAPQEDKATGTLSQEESAKLLESECNNLLSEIDRLEVSRDMQNKRLRNVMELAFSSVNIEDSKTMQELTTTALDDSRTMKALTRAAVQDSAAMKQIAYLTMIFLPSSFIATVFGMNVTVFDNGSGTLAHYFATAAPLSILTIWAVIALNPKKNLSGEPEIDTTLASRLKWPLAAGKKLFSRKASALDHEAQKEPPSM